MSRLFFILHILDLYNFLYVGLATIISRKKFPRFNIEPINKKLFKLNISDFQMRFGIAYISENGFKITVKNCFELEI